MSVDLASLQRRFQRLVAEAGALDAASAAALVAPSSRRTPEQRVAVYANAYHARLIECMGAFFPVTRKLVGAGVFDDFAFGYLQRRPSRSYTLHRLGDRFADHLEGTRPADVPSPGWPELLVDLARYERALVEVFDGPGVERGGALDAARLAALPPDRWADLRLPLSPAVRLLTTRFPVHEYYGAVRAAPEGERVDAPAPRTQHHALSRRDYVVRRHALAPEAFALLEALRDGLTLGDALDVAGDVDAGTVRRWFATWTHGAFFMDPESAAKPLESEPPPGR